MQHCYISIPNLTLLHFWTTSIAISFSNICTLIESEEKFIIRKSNTLEINQKFSLLRSSVNLEDYPQKIQNLCSHRSLFEQEYDLTPQIPQDKSKR